MSDAPAAEMGSLVVADAGPPGTLLRTHFPAGAFDVVAPFCGCGALPGAVGFVDYGAVEDVSAEGEVQVGGGVGGEAEGFHVGKGVDCCEDCGGRRWCATGGEDLG